jgi:hypothetical protein
MEWKVGETRQVEVDGLQNERQTQLRKWNIGVFLLFKYSLSLSLSLLSVLRFGS